MSWQPHSDFICNKGNPLLGFLYRNLQYWCCPSNLNESSLGPTNDLCYQHLTTTGQSGTVAHTNVN